MALARDASSPARATAASVTSNGDTTTASFTAPAGALLVAIVESDSFSAASGITVTTTDTGSLTWTTQAKSTHDTDAAIDGGLVWIATAVTSSAVSRTVRAQFACTSGDGGSGRLDISVHVITGQHATPIGATLNGTVLTTNNSTPTVFTSTATGSMMLVGVTDWSQLGVPTSTDLTDTGGDYSGAISVMDGYKTLGSPGSQTVNIDFGGSGTPMGSWAAIEVVPAASGTPQALTGKATISQKAKTTVIPAAKVGAKARLSSQAQGTRIGVTSMGGKATLASQGKPAPKYGLPLTGAAATVTTRVGGLITQFKFLALQTRFSPSMRGALNTTVPLQTSASSRAMFSLAGSTSRTTALSGQATAAAQSKGATAGTTLLSGLTKAVTRAGSTIAGSVILSIQTRISPAMRGALNSAVLPTAIALAAAAAVISRARATAIGQTSLSGQTASVMRASSGLKAAAYIAGKTVAQTRAAASAILRSALAATGALRSAARGAIGGTLPLLGRAAVAASARAGLPIAAALVARAMAAVRGTSAPSAITAITGRSTLRNMASAQVRLTTLIAALARVSSAARATSSAAVALSTAARATLAFQARATFSGVLGLAARAKAATAARIGQGFSTMRAGAAMRTSARALLFVLRPVIHAPVFPRPGRLGRLRESLEKAFGETFDIEPMTAGVDTNSRIMPDISRDAKIDVIGIWQGPTTTRAPIARGAMQDDNAHNWNVSFPSVRFDAAAIAGVRKGDTLTRKLDGAVYLINRVVPDGFGRTTVQLTSRQRTTN